MSTVFEFPCFYSSNSCYDTAKYTVGDGTVPWVSASLQGKKGNTTVCTMSNVTSEHSNLMKDPTVYNLIYKILSNDPLASSDCQETTPKTILPFGLVVDFPLKAFIEVVVNSNSNVSVIDASGHKASVSSDGTIVNDIPLSSFNILGKTTTITLPITSIYTLSIQQSDSEPVKLRVTDFRNQSSVENFDPYQRAVFVDVPSTVGGIATLSINYTNGMSALQILLDNDGNGSNDQTFMPTSILDQKLKAKIIQYQLLLFRSADPKQT